MSTAITFSPFGRSGDLLVDRPEEEGIQRGWSVAALRLEGEHGPELVVALKEDPIGAEVMDRLTLRTIRATASSSPA